MRLSRSYAVEAILALAVLSGGASPAWGRAEKVYGEVTADQALLYLIWPDRSRITWQVYLDDRLLWQTKGNSYGFAHVDPGLHWVWGSGRPIQMEFVPGQTYYILALQGLSTLSADEGKQYLEKVKRHQPLPTPQQIASKSNRARKWLPKHIESQLERGRIEIAEVPALSKPADTDGLIRVPRHAPIELELAQSITTIKNFTGARVWFRVAEDADVDGKVWLRAGTFAEGTIVYAEQAGRGGVGGHFEVVIPAVTAADGTPIPLISRLASAGRPRSTKGAAAFGLLGMAFMAKRGREGYELAGTRWPAWTRSEVWVRSPVERDLTPESPADSVTTCQARAVAPLSIAPESRVVTPADVEILIEADDEIRSFELAQVSGWGLPDPPEALRLAPHEEGQVAVFEGWDLLRYLMPEERAAVRFQGVLNDGTRLECVANLHLKVGSTSGN